MSLLTKDDIRAAGGIVHSDGNVFFTNLEQLNAAILAKLASAELPEPLKTYPKSKNVGAAFSVYSSAQLQQAHAQGFAAGAASQLAEKPSGYLSQYNLEMLQQGYPQTIVMIEGAKRDVPLYTRREAK